MKNLLLATFLLAAGVASAQKIGGFYSGTLRNDSAHMIQKYELALSEYRGKISGYSYVTFVANDTFYYGIRKIKAEIVGDSLIVSDDKMIINNFPEKPAKGVGRTITIPLKGQDSLVVLSGTWKTNQTKKYYSVPGAIELSRSQDSAHSPLIGHLMELNLIAQPNYQNTAATETGSEPVVVKETKSREEEKPKKLKKEKLVVDNDVATVKEKEDKVKQEEDKKNRKNKAVSNNDAGDVNVTAGKVTGKNENTEEPKTKEKINEAAVTKTQKKDTRSVMPAAPPAKLPFDQRKNREIQTVETSSDSLVLSFYDNGVVDGDSISVYMNDVLIVAAIKLTTVANKKTIALPQTGDIRITLVAENLGSLPPNTGLMTIRDGGDVYQVNFSADMQTNATVVIRRKK